MWRSLQQSGDISGGEVPGFEVMKAKMDDWTVQMIDVTNEGKVDVVLTISGSAITVLTQPVNANFSVGEDKIHPRTVILLLNGKVIYSDFATKSRQTLTGR